MEIWEPKPPGTLWPHRTCYGTPFPLPLQLITLFIKSEYYKELCYLCVIIRHFNVLFHNKDTFSCSPGRHIQENVLILVWNDVIATYSTIRRDV
jgi:hypothetical protein